MKTLNPLNFSEEEKVAVKLFGAMFDAVVAGVIPSRCLENLPRKFERTLEGASRKISLAVRSK